MKCTRVCAAQKVYQLFTKLQIKPDFPSLAGGIAEPHPDMNIKVAAFTVVIHVRTITHPNKTITTI